MKLHDLLVLTSAFPFESDYRGIFIKEQLNSICSEFEKINIISPLSYFPQFLLNSEYFRKYSGYREWPKNYSYNNVNVFFPKYFPLPPNYLNKTRLPLNKLAINGVLDRRMINFDLIHAHFVLPSGYVGASLKEKFDKPLIVTAHGGDIYSEPFKNKKSLKLTKFVLDRCDKIITTSERNKIIITKKFMIQKEDVSIIRNGYDERIFAPMDKNNARNQLSLKKNSKIILCIGNLIDVKGHKYLIQSMKKIVSHIIDVHCIIIGRGDKIKLKMQIENEGLNNNISIINGVPHQEIPFWINACDLFVLPSLDEGFPTVIPEALGCGKPVVATSVGGIPEIINRKFLGLLVEKENYSELADSILMALQKDWDFDRISNYAKKNYTWDIISKEILNIYKSVVEEY